MEQMTFNIELDGNKDFVIQRTIVVPCDIFIGTQMQLIYIYNGYADFLLCGNKFRLNKNNYIVLDRTLPFRIDEAYQCDAVVIRFNAEFLNCEYKSINTFRDLLNNYPQDTERIYHISSEYCRFFNDNDGRVETLIDNLLSEYIIGNTGSKAAVKALLTLIILDILRQLQNSRIILSSDISYVIEMIATDYNNDIFLNKLAHDLNMKKEQLSKKFLSECNLNYIDYLQMLRIDKACTLLADTKMSISDISRGIGYENVGYFIGLFIRIKGLRPAEYRFIYSDSKGKGTP